MKTLKAIKMDKMVMAFGIVAVVFGISAVIGLGLSLMNDGGVANLHHNKVALVSIAASNDLQPSTQVELASVVASVSQVVTPTQKTEANKEAAVAVNPAPVSFQVAGTSPATTINDDEVIVKFNDNAGWSGMSYIDPSVASNSTTNNDVDHFLSQNNLTVAGYYRPQNTFTLKTKDGSSVKAKLDTIAKNPIVASVQTKSVVNISNTALASLTSTAINPAPEKSTKVTESRNGLRMAMAVNSPNEITGQGTITEPGLSAWTSGGYVYINAADIPSTGNQYGGIFPVTGYITLYYNTQKHETINIIDNGTGKYFRNSDGTWTITFNTILTSSFFGSITFSMSGTGTTDNIPFTITTSLPALIAGSGNASITWVH